MRTSSPSLSDRRLSSLRELISRRAMPTHPPPGEPEDRSHAAVSLILRTGPELEALLIRRAEFEEDPWSGHIALPGGRWDPRDPDLLATAIRETLEETGVRLDQEGVLLGELPALVPATRRLPPLSIFPFVFGVGEGTRARVASHEIDEVLWTPLRALQNPAAAGTVTIQFEDATRAFPCIRVEERVIWGLTYRILTRFLKELEAHQPALLGHL